MVASRPVSLVEMSERQVRIRLFGPIEIETVLREHPSVADVAAAGVPDAEMGERVGVAIVARAAMTADEVKAYCRERLAIYKTPEYVVFVDDLPYSDTGKVVRRQLVEVIESQLSRR